MQKNLNRAQNVEETYDTVRGLSSNRLVFSKQLQAVNSMRGWQLVRTRAGERVRETDEWKVEGREDVR